MQHKVFHLKANDRRCKNFIRKLTTQDGVEVSDHEQKAQVLRQHFSSLLGHAIQRTMGIYWDSINHPSQDFSHLDEPLTIDELKEVISNMHVEKAPGPDGFIGAFYKSCWDIVRVDLLGAVNQMHNLNGDSCHLLNMVNIVLIPKKDAVSSPLDFRPVSLMHSVAKILGKLLASRLAPELDGLISVSQSAFIKRWSIQDNFLYVRNVVKEDHLKKKPLQFLKLDFAKVFDSVKWDFLLEALKAYAFSDHWRDLIPLVLGTSSSCVLLNGLQGIPFIQRHGQR